MSRYDENNFNDSDENGDGKFNYGSNDIDNYDNYQNNHIDNDVTNKYDIMVYCTFLQY
jgi:hypothetical protein